MIKYIIIIIISFILFYLITNILTINKTSYNYILQEKLFYNTDDLQFKKLKLLEYNYKTILSEMPPFDIKKVTVKRNQDEWLDKVTKKVSNDTLQKIKSSGTWIEG